MWSPFRTVYSAYVPRYTCATLFADDVFIRYSFVKKTPKKCTIARGGNADTKERRLLDVGIVLIVSYLAFNFVLSGRSTHFCSKAVVAKQCLSRKCQIRSAHITTESKVGRESHNTDKCRLLPDRVERKQTLCSNTLLYDGAALTVRQILAMHSDTESTLLHDSNSNRGIRVRVRTQRGQEMSSSTRRLAANWTTTNFFPPRRCNITTNAGNTCRNKQDRTNRMDPSWT
jgi:hypothetical protein